MQSFNVLLLEQGGGNCSQSLKSPLQTGWSQCVRQILNFASKSDVDYRLHGFRTSIWKMRIRSRAGSSGSEFDSAGTKNDDFAGR